MSKAQVGSGAAVIAGETPEAVSVGMSRALYAAAPIVVVAVAGNAVVATHSAALAATVGAPLLLTSPGSRPAVEQVLAEVRRLHARFVLADGPGAATALQGSRDVSVVTDAARLPPVTGVRVGAGVSVLVADDGGATSKPAVAAAAAVARAAGAGLVLVRGGDPRADPAAILALSRQRPRRVLAVGAGFGPPERLAARVAVAATGIQLPGGGQVMFPGRRLVALYGVPGAPVLGALGEQGLAASIARAKRLAASYAARSSHAARGWVPTVPTFELIATVAQGSAGHDGNYSGELTAAALKPWVDQAGRAGVYVVLDLQPGRANLLDQTKRYASLLALPHVGLALDPEWKLGPGQHPLGQIGSVGAAEVNSVIGWLSAFTAARKLPSKVLVLHQFRPSMLRDEHSLDTRRDNISVLLHMDGQGATRLKDVTWRAVINAAPPGVAFGWKNFYDEDSPTLTPAETLRRRPTPAMVSYQ